MMRKLRREMVVFTAITALLAGCKSSQSATPPSGGSAGSGTQSSGKPGPVKYVSASPLPSQFTTAKITDPSLNNIVSATLTIPAGWKLQGITMISSCTFSPWPVFRAYSPDGLMQIRTEPVIGWQWHPNLRGTLNNGCANLSGAVSAANFLEYYIGTMKGGVHVVGPMAVAPAYSQWAQGLAAQKNQANSRVAPGLQAQNIADTAALRIQVVNGSFLVEERLRTAVECSVINNASSPYAGGTCWARVDVLSAPVGQLDALVGLVDANNLPHGVNSAQWTQAALLRQQKQGAKAFAALTAQEQQESKAIYQQFQQIMQRSAVEHAAFMRQQESQFESAMDNAYDSMDARSEVASDWVDYSLDQETVLNPDGTTSKVSNQYSQTWTDGTHWYQSNDTGVNPNGSLQGNWSPVTQVHGNGTPE